MAQKKAKFRYAVADGYSFGAAFGVTSHTVTFVHWHNWSFVDVQGAGTEVFMWLNDGSTESFEEMPYPNAPTGFTAILEHHYALCDQPWAIDQLVADVGSPSAPSVAVAELDAYDCADNGFVNVTVVAPLT